MFDPPWGQAGRAATLGLVAGIAKLFLTVGNKFEVDNHKVWLDAIYNRPKGQGLITIANHTSMFDDPGVICALTPLSFFWSEPWHGGNRWTLCAKEVCFKNELLRQFFASGKTLPIVRGDGVHQPVMKLAGQAVSRGDWVHVFPEGRIHFSGQLGPFRWGVGKMVCDHRAATGQDPMVVPFYHSGMGRILPMGKVMFRLGNDLKVTVGEPLDLSAISCRCNQPGEDQGKVWEDLTQVMYRSLKALEDRSPPNINQIPDKDPVTEGVKDQRRAPA